MHFLFQTLKATLVTMFLLASPSMGKEAQTRESKEIECLAHNIYYESRGEPRKGQIAVGHVTMNRVKAKGFPSTVCDVVTQKSKTFCAFSWNCMKNLPPLRPEKYEEVKELAFKIYHGKIRDVTQGATHFHNTTVKPAWAETKRVTAEIGQHVFYRN